MRPTASRLSPASGSQVFPSVGATYADKIISRFENDDFPWLGDKPIADITPPQLLAVISRRESQGALDTAHV